MASRVRREREGGDSMTTIHRREDESIDDVLRRFKRELKKQGTLREARRHEHYEKPSEAKKRKRIASKRRKKS